MKKDFGKIGLVCSGGFKRLAAHYGALCYLFEEEQKGKISRPDFMIGSSAGAIACAALNPWKESVFRRVGETIYNLRASQIYKLRNRIRLLILLTGVESLYSLLNLLILPKGSSIKKRFLVELVESLASAATESDLLHELLEQPSLCSSEPLRKLLSGKDGLDFPGIWSSDIRLEIPAVDLLTEKEVIFTNYLDRDRNHPNRNQMLLDFIMASASIPAHFPAVKVGNYRLDDAAIKSSIPIHRAVEAGCDTIFVMVYSFNGTSVRVENWVEELTRAIDILINENTKQTLREFLFDEKRVAGVRIIPIFSDIDIPDLNFRQFGSRTMNLTMGIGYEAMKQNLENPELWKERLKKHL